MSQQGKTMSQFNNLYYEKLKVVINAALEIFKDGKVTMPEVWIFLLTLVDAVKIVSSESVDLSDDDLIQLKEAASLLYDEYVLPLDIPGPDFIIDPFVRNGLLPGLVEGAVILAKKQIEKSTAVDQASTDIVSQKCIVPK